jgi:hypothetical protein
MRNMRIIKTTVAMLLLGFFSLCGCKIRENAILVLDEQWSAKKAEADCQSPPRESVPPCTGDPAVELRNFEAQISRAFRVDPACSGITLVTLNVSDHPRRLRSRRTWWLFLELIPGGGPNKRRFSVSRTEDPKANPLRGQGEANLIAETSCKFVQGRVGTH